MSPSATSRAREFPRLLILLMLAVILLAPLPLGSNRPVFESLLSISAGLGLLLWGAHLLRTGQGLLLNWKIILAPGLCALATLLWAAAQLFPLPTTFAHPVWQNAGSLLERSLTGYLTVDPSATRIGLIRMGGYVALFTLAFQMGRSNSLTKRLVLALAFSSACYAGYGLINYAMGNQLILWLPKQNYTDSLTSTFVNRNAFAAYCGMGLLASVALLLQHFHRELGKGSRAMDLAYLLARAPIGIWLLLTASLALGLALILSNSRAGTACVAAGLAVMWTGCFIRQLLPRRILLVIAIVFGMAGAAGLILAGDSLISRLDQQVFDKDERADIWTITLQMIRDAPLSGQGFNTYDQLFSQYRTDRIWLRYTRAHNSYLELAAELGLPATLMWFSAFLLIGLRLLKGIRERRQNQFYPLLALAVLIQAGLHAMVDFSFQIPANAALLAIVLGLGSAQSVRSSDGQA